jgi:hypothetical protein
MKHGKLNLSFGTDPEVMVLNTDTNKIVSSIPVVKRNKHNPIDLGDGVKVYADNVLLESSMPPEFTVADIVDGIGSALTKVQKFLGLSNRMAPVAAHVFDDLPPRPDDDLVLKWLEDLVPPDAIAEEWQVGCSPNWDAYGECQRKQTPFQNGLRSGSFHLHIGNADWADGKDTRLLTPKSKIMAIKLLDIYVGCASVLFDKDPSSAARRALYGKAGEFRPTPYGIEYRVLGNYALRHPELVTLVYDLAAHAMTHIEDDSATFMMESFDFNMVQAAINESNTRLARLMLDDSWLPARLYDKLGDLQDKNYTEDSTLLNWGI